jgi:Ca-activated chloride channel homolog
MHRDFATALYDAIVQGSDALGKHEGRRALIVISDGDDTLQDKTYADALEHALRNQVMIYSLIDVPIEASAGRDTGGEHTLITLAQQTGGKYFYVTQEKLDATFKKVSEDLRTQYLVGYYPQNQLPGVDFHRITVTIPRAANGDFNLRYRMGYYSEEAN